MEVQQIVYSNLSRALSRALEELKGDHDLGAFLDSILRETVTTSGAATGSIFVLDEKARVLKQKALRIRGVSCLPSGAYRDQGRTIEQNRAWDAITASGQIYWTDYHDPKQQDWPESVAFHRKYRHRLIAAVPMLIGEDAIGFIGLAFDESIAVHPEPHRLELAQLFASYAALAVHLTELAGDTQNAAIAQERRRFESTIYLEKERATVNERARLAREMHDTLLQGFAGLMLQLRAVIKTLEAEQHSSSARFQSIYQEGLAAVRDARRAVDGLRSTPDDSTLVRQLSAFIELQQGNHPEIEFSLSTNGEHRSLCHTVQENLFRTAREAIRNSLKHAKPRSIRVSMLLLEHELEMNISDDGIGFIYDKKFLPDGHWGLLGIEERAKFLGGSFGVQSKLGSGTTISVRVPL